MHPSQYTVTITEEHDSFYLCLYFHLQYGSNYGQEVADNNQHIPAIQKLTLVILTHFTIVVLVQESGESLNTQTHQCKLIKCKK